MNRNEINSTLVELLETFQGEGITARDNAKLIFSVLSNKGLQSRAHEAHYRSSEQDSTKTIYCIHCQGLWVNCGTTNDYSAQMSLMSTIEAEKLSDIQDIELPVLGEQQISAMMMQYAHFDHC